MSQVRRQTILTDVQSGKVGILCSVEDIVHAAGELLEGGAVHQLLIAQRGQQGAPLSLLLLLPLAGHWCNNTYNWQCNCPTMEN